MKIFFIFLCLTSCLIGGEVEIAGTSFFCRSIGQGDPLVIVHGGPGFSMDYLLPYMDRLQDSHLVLFYDQRGAGKSQGDITEDTMTMDQMVQDLEGLRKVHRWEKFSLLGHSFGALLAKVYASRYPEHVDRLVLVTPSLGSNSKHNDLFQKQWDLRMGPFQEALLEIREEPGFDKGDPDIMEIYFEEILSTYLHHPHNIDKLNFRMSQKEMLAGEKIRAIFTKTLFAHYDYRNEFKKITAPTLIFFGKSDVAPLSIGRDLAEEIPQAKLVILEESGHFPYMEQEDLFFTEIERFFEETSRI